MFIKVLGAALLFGIGSVSAYFSAKFEKQKLTVLDGWISMIQYVKSQIECYLKPLNQILAEAEEQKFLSCGCLGRGSSLSEVLSASVGFLSEDTENALRQFIEEIGNGYEEDQMRKCNFILTLLQSERERLSRELQGKIKRNVALCLSLSLGAAVLFW